MHLECRHRQQGADVGSAIELSSVDLVVPNANMQSSNPFVKICHNMAANILYAWDHAILREALESAAARRLPTSRRAWRGFLDALGTIWCCNS